MITKKRLLEIHRVISAAGLKLPEFTLEPLSHDASQRRYLRLRPLKGAGQTMAVMDVGEGVKLPDDPAADPFVNVQRHFRKSGVQVPQVFHYLAGDGLILMEDCGDTTLEAHLQRGKNPDWRSLYRMAVDEIIKIQYRAGRADQKDCLAFHRALDEAKLLQELDFFLSHTVEGYLQRKIPPADRGEIGSFFTELCRALAAVDRVLNHRDFHSRNLMWTGERLLVLDFQDALMGPCQYDLVSLLKDSYVNPSEALAAEMIDYYRKLRRETLGVDSDPQEFMEVFYLTTVQRSLKAAGTFGYQYRVFGAKRYLAGLPTVLRYAREAAAKVPLCREFLPLFHKYFGI